MQFNEHKHTHRHTYAIVVGRGAVAGCTRISSQEYVHINEPPGRLLAVVRITRMLGPDCAVMCNLINTHTHTHTESVSPLSRLIRGFRNKYH